MIKWGIPIPTLLLVNWYLNFNRCSNYRFYFIFYVYIHIYVFYWSVQ